MKKLFDIVLLCLCFSANAMAADYPDSTNAGLGKIGVPYIINYTPKKYHASPQNYAAVQDNNGIMYFANLWGVLQFDGVQWHQIGLPNGSSCTSITKDKNGVIYIGGRNELGYLSPDSIGKMHYVSLRNKVPAGVVKFNEIWATYNTPQGIIFASYEASLLKPSGKNEIVLLANSDSNAILPDSVAYLLKQGSICCYVDFSLKNAKKPSSFNHTIFSAVPVGHSLLCATDKGLFTVKDKKFTLWNAPVNWLFKSSGFKKIIPEQGGRLVFITETNGIVITDINGEIIFHLNKSSGILTDDITDGYFDKANNLWLASNFGLSYVALSSQYQFIKDDSGVTGIPYSSALYNGYLYLGTSDGLFRKKIALAGVNQNQAFEKVNAVTNIVWSLTPYDGKLFCGQASGVYVIDKEKIEKIYDAGTWNFHPVNNKLMLIGTYNGLGVLWKNDNNQWVFRNSISGFKESSRFVVQDRYGDIWVSHGNQGVYQIRPDNSLHSAIRVKFFGRKEGLPTNFDNTVHYIGKNILISSSTGIFKYNYDSEKIAPFTPLTNLLGDKVHVDRLVEDKENNLWVVYNFGTLAKLRMVNPNLYKILWAVSKLKNNWIESFEHLDPISNRFVVLGTKDGFCMLRSDEKINTHNYNCYISSFAISGDKSAVLWNGFKPGEIRVNKSLTCYYKSIKISYTAPRYDDLENIQYRYYLEGFDNNQKWSSWNVDNFKEYTNLKEGVYRFHVMAINADGTTSNENTLEFTILPPWYRTTWAYFIYLFSVGAFFVLITLFMNKKVEKAKRKVEAEKQLKLLQKQVEWEEAMIKKEKILVDLTRQKLEIEAQNLQREKHLLAQNIEKEKEQAKMQQQQYHADIAAKNNELTSLTVNITQKNEILLQIKNSLHKINSETTEQETKGGIALLEQLIEKNLNSAKEWEKFREHFDIVHQGFLQKLQHHYPDLKISALKLCAYLKMKLSSKQMAVLMNTETESVVTARYRLRLRFKLPKEITLEEFLNTNFDD